MLFDELFTAENDLRQIATEDGYVYLPTYSVVAKVGNDNYEHPHIFEYETDAENFIAKVEAKGIINEAIWGKYEPAQRYSDGNNEPYDDEERYYLNLR